MKLQISARLRQGYVFRSAKILDFRKCEAQAALTVSVPLDLTFLTQTKNDRFSAQHPKL